MVTATGTFDGKAVILDRLPQDIPPNTRVTVQFETDSPRGLDALIEKARPADTPPDLPLSMSITREGRQNGNGGVY